MAKETSKTKFEAAKETASMLENILNGMDAPNMAALEAKSENLPTLSKSPSFDYDTIKEISKNAANSTVRAIAILYLPQEFIDSNAYITAKLENDIEILEGFLFSKHSADHAIRKLHETIDEGVPRDRTFEVLGNLQRSKVDILEKIALATKNLEESYKQLRKDYFSEETTKSEIVVEAEQQGGLKFRGMKDLLRALQEANEDDVEGEGFEEVK